jgi:CHAT domain-containing protein
MSILHDGKQYLVEKYALALTPGLQLLDPKPLASVNLKALIAGLSQIREDFEPHKNFKAQSTRGNRTNSENWTLQAIATQ